jgi:hypothetical protein
MLESDFSTKVLRLLRADIPGSWRKNPVSAFGQAGVADIIGCVNGRYVEVELKAPGKYKIVWDGVTELQKTHGQEIVANGGVWVVGDHYPSIIGALRQRISEKSTHRLCLKKSP